MSGKFYDELNITKLYCETQLKNTQKTTASILRSINPVYNDKDFFEFSFSSYPMTVWTIWPWDNNHQALVSELFTAQLKQKTNLIYNFENANLIRGRILISDFDESIFDSASEAESEGFIDNYDLPPIDTWIYLTHRPNGLRRLYSWIPEKFVYLVERAIAVNCVDCLNWDNSDLHNQ